jgi:hypothetical protein
MLVKWRPDFDALAAVLGCFGAVFERSSTSCSHLTNVVQCLFLLTRPQGDDDDDGDDGDDGGYDESVTILVLVTRESTAPIL